MSLPCIITCAITGAEVTKSQNPAVPYTIDEMAEAAFLAKKAGASIIHLHARWDDGSPTQDPQRFMDIIKAIKERCDDIIIQISTGGAIGMNRDERSAPLQKGIEMATLDCGTVNFGGDDYFINTENDIIFFAEKMNQLAIQYELECFDKGHVDMANRLYKKGFIKGPLHYSFVLGVVGGMTAELRDFMFLKESIPSEATFSVAGVGKAEFPLAEYSIMHGGHVRVGLEDNLYLEKGVLATNETLVQKAAELIIKHHRHPASVCEARRILGLR